MRAIGMVSALLFELKLLEFYVKSIILYSLDCDKLTAKILLCERRLRYL